MTINHKKTGLLSYLIGLTCIFILLEISFAIQGSEFYLGDFKLMASHLDIPAMVIPGIIFFIFAQLLIHFSYALIIWGVARLASIPLRFSWQQTQTLGFSLWILGLVTILLANQHYFPNSKFSDLLGVFIHFKLTLILLFLCSTTCTIAILFALIGLFLLIQQSRFLGGLFLIALSILISLSLLTNYKPLVIQAATADKPNVIIIGVDALRPDFLKYAPHLSHYLKKATVFSGAMTPLARTFPAWVSILTGKYPKEMGVRFDLADQSSLDLSETLPAVLQHNGYETIYATDESRFSNMNETFGFDRVIEPPMGFNDFLLGTLNDFPLSNLLVNSTLGQWLFPYSYANRAVYVTYEPTSFLTLLQSRLSFSSTKPTFLAIHFCLPHYPYFWAGYSHADTTSAVAHYRASVKEADQQLNQFLKLLHRSGVLEHSIVVLLSDHGEALELNGDRVTEQKMFLKGLSNIKGIIPRFYPPAVESEKVNQSAGHGTDVLGMTQYRSVLAFRLKGFKSNQAQKISGTVSLMDIYPTILQCLGIVPNKVTGVSLTDAILKKKTFIQSSHDFLMESDFSPEAIRSVYPKMRDTVFEGIAFYQLDPATARFTQKKSMGETIISSKQYADLSANWILALYPKPDHHMTPILVNLKTGQWTDDMRIPFALHSPAKEMLLRLKAFYGNEITTIDNTSLR